ncbi:MAG: hypothetical protein OJF51_001307 [Nitrospira sp.]|nr:MAG: hypothetical protein OJF51_001307 [Nitrospira sp.]
MKVKVKAKVDESNLHSALTSISACSVSIAAALLTPRLNIC